jgi:hypothetical protein
LQEITLADARNWTCPFCNRPQVVTEGQSEIELHSLGVATQKYKEPGLLVNAVACANPECREITLTVHFVETTQVIAGHGYRRQLLGNFRESFPLRPSHSSKPQPDYIPAPLREDYLEACKVRDLSPKSSATLARRCLQGMIRNFCGIAKGRLIDEIRTLRELSDAGNAPKGVEPETVEAIDHVRSIGNIGAHMEKDINTIVDVDPGEAQALIELIELLFDEWYVARRKREEKLAKVKEIKLQKEGVIEAAKAKKPMEPDATASS